MNLIPNKFMIVNAEPDQFCIQAKIILQKKCILVEATSKNDLYKKLKNADG